MTEESRREWLAVAWNTLSHLPADLLSIGCRKARETCDHPSRIVPTILRETEESLKFRQSRRFNYAASLPAPTKKRNVMDRRGDAMSVEDTDELNNILAGLGAAARYRPDGSRYFTDGRDSDATATAAHCEDNAVPQDLQARCVSNRPDYPAKTTSSGA